MRVMNTRFTSMRYNYSFLIPALLVVLLGSAFVGCKQNKTDKESELLLDTITTLESIPLTSRADTPSMEISINYIFPLKDSILQKRFNTLMFGDSLSDLKAQDAVKVYVEQLGKDYRKYNSPEEGEDVPSFIFDQTFELSDSIVYTDADFVNIAISNYIYEGGAHGSNTVRYYNITRKTGSVISEMDLFNEGYEDELSKVMVECLLQSLHKTSPADLESEGFFDSEKIRPNGNFIINEKGLTYCFNEYEIAPYAMGTIFITIPYEKLDALLKQEAPVRKFMNQK